MRDRETKIVLIETAERLFAEQGIERVSLRQITVAAKQKNTSALHYHFGSRQNLIEAIFALRTSRINERRLQVLADVHEHGRAHDLRELVAVMVNPLAERLVTSDGIDYYVRFLAQAHLSPQVDVERIIQGRFDEGLVRAGRLIRQILTEVPPAVLDGRLTRCAPHMAYALAEWQMSMIQSGIELNMTRLICFADNLIDFIVGGLSAPVAEAPTTTIAQPPPSPRTRRRRAATRVPDPSGGRR